MIKIVAGIVAVIAVFAYLAPVVVKLHEVDLTIVVLCGVVMMLVDLWDSLKSREA